MWVAVIDAHAEVPLLDVAEVDVGCFCYVKYSTSLLMQQNNFYVSKPCSQVTLYNGNTVCSLV